MANRYVALSTLSVLIALSCGFQTPAGAQYDRSSPARPMQAPPAERQDRAPQILDVRIVGNETIPESRILARLKTRPGRYYDSDLVQADAQEIMAMKDFRDVRTFTQPTPDGLVVTYEVVERPVVHSLQFLGNRAISDRTLGRQIAIEEGDPLDLFAVKLARQRLEEYYHRKGFAQTEVEVLEGSDASHRNVVFLIHEDQKRRVWKAEFIGNTIATDARLRTFIETKPGFLKYFFGGKVDEEEIENDVKRITAYYRSLGYFDARIGREIEYDNDESWLTLRFIIDEGPQYQVQHVSIAGNERFGTGELLGLLELKSGDSFNSDRMQRDIGTLRDLYGSLGHIQVQVKADPLFLDDIGRMELVYQIEEGEVYRVRHINVHIAGEYGITKRSVVLNRISLSPGDVIDIRKIRDSERRLRASGLFVSEPGQGQPPRLAVTPVDPLEGEQLARRLASARPNDNFRGQSPNVNIRWVDVTIDIE